MDGAAFLEWIAYDSLEPIDPAGALLAGFAKPSGQPQKATGWKQQLQTMKNLFPGKKKDG